jgi:SAM-dependent methyltransferase
MEIPTLLRQAEHEALKGISLSGSILDLGGGGNADYRSLIGGEHTFTTVDLGQKADIQHDLEELLPLADASYDHALLINVLEHIYDFRQLLAEAVRVTKPGGTLVIVVPFLFPVHPSPNDYWRFSGQTLEREMERVGLTIERLTPLGTGVFSARSVMLDRLMPGPVRALGLLVRPLIIGTDRLFTALAHALGKKYDPADYALGYALIARNGR